MHYRERKGNDGGKRRRKSFWEKGKLIIKEGMDWALWENGKEMQNKEENAKIITSIGAGMERK